MKPFSNAFTMGPALSEVVLGYDGGLGHTGGQLEVWGVGQGRGDHKKGQKTPDDTSLKVRVPFKQSGFIQNPHCLLQHWTPMRKHKPFNITLRIWSYLGNLSAFQKTENSINQFPAFERSTRCSSERRHDTVSSGSR